MKQALLLRQAESDEGTFGTLSVYEDGALLYQCFTGELPDRNNQVQMSCIPTGKYMCQPWHTKKFPNHYNVMRVPGRTAILIHEGNFCGDKTKGYLRNVAGCILVGRALGTLRGQRAVLSSKLAMKDLRKAIGEEKFFLEVKKGYDS